MKLAGRVLKNYSRVIAACIPLFVTAGLLSIFSAGIFQNKYLFEMSHSLSFLVIPVFMGYKAGTMCGGDVGGLAGTLAASAVVMTEPASAVILSAIAGSIAGFFCRKGLEKIKHWIPSGFEMLVSNFYLAGLGVLAGVLTHFFLTPAAAGLFGFLGNGLSFMIEKGVIPFISVVVEPLKIMFFNNWINHGFFLPLGLEQMKTKGSSILFLLETNPGPGFGILLAHALVYRSMRKQMLSSLIIQSLGGIHEIYFPYVLSDIRLLAAAIVGGIAGNYCFMVTGSGLLGPASPGSIITIMIMADKRHWLGIVMGILISAVVTCLLSCLIMSKKKGKTAIKNENEDIDEDKDVVKDEDIDKDVDKDKDIDKDKDKDKDENVDVDKLREDGPRRKRMEHVKIYFVCDVGMGSSAMASALFKKKLKMEGFTGAEVFHVSADRIPDDADAIVCQKDFARFLSGVKKPCFPVNNLTDMSDYNELLNWLMGGERDGR